MKIGILQTGRSPDKLRDQHGDYDAFFVRLLSGRGFDFVTYPVLDGVLPESEYEADGWLITGSKLGVYEPHPWIAPIKEFLRRAYAAEVPIVGVCFGHQILAEALGGRVEKFDGGWSVGATEYGGAIETDRVMAWHQDQIVELPDDAEVLSSSDFCPYAMLQYGTKALTVQPHPEFTADFMRDLLSLRREILPDYVAAQAEDRMDDPLTSTRFADVFTDFFRAPRNPNKTGNTFDHQINAKHMTEEAR